MTYPVYNTYTSLLSIDLETYFKKIDVDKLEWFKSLSDYTKSQLNMFDIISEDVELQEQYRKILEFFFVENIIWENNYKAYFTYVNKDDDGNIIPIGIITKERWNEICDVILQRCGLSNTENNSKLKFKNKAAKRIWKKTHKKELNTDKNIELPNIISSYSAFANSVNIINIWDMTVYQLYDQFQRQRINNYFNISCMSVAAWGDKENHFDNDQWYKNIYEN